MKSLTLEERGRETQRGGGLVAEKGMDVSKAACAICIVNTIESKLKLFNRNKTSVAVIELIPWSFLIVIQYICNSVHQ